MSDDGDADSCGPGRIRPPPRLRFPDGEYILDADARCLAHVLYTCPHCTQRVTVGDAVGGALGMTGQPDCVCPHCLMTIPSWRGESP